MYLQNDLPVIKSTNLNQRKECSMENRLVTKHGQSINFLNLKKSRFYGYWKYKYLVLMFIPAIVYYVIFHYIPIYGVTLAFKKFEVLRGIMGSPWVGLENFEFLVTLGSFWEVFRNTILISIYKTVWGFPAPIIFAILLNEIKNAYFKKTIQSVSYLPHFVSWVVLSGLFIQFLSPSIGPINIILKNFGLRPIYFMGDARWFRSVLVGTHVWKELGWGSIIYLANIANINPEIYEAAIVDGANRFKRILHVTLPSLSPVITIMFIFAMGKLINDDFDQVFNMANRSVLKVADVISTYTYRMGLGQGEYSFATAVGLFKNIISLTMIVITNSIAKKVNEYGIW